MFVSQHHPLYQTNEVGKANPTLRNLPQKDHFYGYKPPPQPEGVKESMLKSHSSTSAEETEKRKIKRKKFFQNKYSHSRLKYTDQKCKARHKKNYQERSTRNGDKIA